MGQSASAIYKISDFVPKNRCFMNASFNKAGKERDITETICE